MTIGSAVLSVDMELFSHTPAYRSAAGVLQDPTVGLEGLEFLLDEFAARDATSTFFTVADIADTHPEVVARIAAAGHEIASHTRTHTHLSEIDEDGRRDELLSSRELLEAASGAEVSGFRAPSFDLPRSVFPMVTETGYEYDSSVVPSRSIPGWYGGEYSAIAPCRAADIDSASTGQLMELPVAVMPRLRLPLTGTWIRFFGLRYTVLGMRLLARRGLTPVLYVHPWELVDLPRIRGVPRRIYWRTGQWMRRAVSDLLDQPFDYIQARTLAEDYV